MKPCVVILNPRQIPECMAAFAALDVDKAYLTGYTEQGLVEPFSALVRDTDYSHYVAVSDDVIVTQEALEGVLELLAQDHPVVTGYCNLDATSPLVNLTRGPLASDYPTVEAYDFCTRAEIDAGPFVALTGFAGMCLTGMSRAMWQAFPFKCYGDPGYASDFHLCKRLELAGFPIVAPRGGFVHHVKETWNTPDCAHDKRLRIGENQGVRMEYGCPSFV